MQYNDECMACLVNGMARLCKGLGTEEDRREFLKDVFSVFPGAPQGVSASWFIPAFSDAFERHFGIADPYREAKEEANSMSLQVLPELEHMAAEAADPLLMAMKISRTGNFLDYAVLSRETVENGLEKAVREIPGEEFPEEEYRRFVKELETAEKLVILGDNAGEIVFDTVLVKELKRQYPQLQTVYVVRGGNAQNDATPEDAKRSGMSSLTRVIGNGSRIPATEPGYLSRELEQELEEADLILSKGQANFESLVSCGLNIYYLFLCKCPKFSRRLGVPPMTGLFLNDRRLPEFHEEEE